MTDNIQWILEMAVRGDDPAAVKSLVDEMVRATQSNEPGALIYEYYLSEDKSRCSVVERYADNAAVMVHLKNFETHFAERFFALFEPKLFRVYGPANEDVRSALGSLGATFDDAVGGFERMT